MADIEKTEAKVSEKAVDKKDDKKPAKKDKPSFIERVKKFFREYKSELKKVVWATREVTLNNTLLVVVSVAVVSVVIGVLDFAFSTGLVALGKLI
ncbi:MAG: preprotein translocase subunit SecE [Clostridia bacterium]|nr:preprotein translocase subunit SecE [Clostridia bacterium]